MRASQRLTEAIKQTEIALETIEDLATRQRLEQGLDSLEAGLHSLEESAGG